MMPSRFLIVTTTLLLLSKVYAQSHAHHIGVNFGLYAGLSYERAVAPHQSLSISVNKPDWNYANWHQNVSLIKGQLAYRMYLGDGHGFYIAPGLTYRFREDPSVTHGTFSSLFSSWGVERESSTYSIKMHSIGLAIGAGYRTQPILKRFGLDMSLRVGMYPINFHEDFKKVKETTNGETTYYDHVEHEERRKVASKFAGEMVLCTRLTYAF